MMMMATRKAERFNSFGHVRLVIAGLSLLAFSTLYSMSPIKAGHLESIVQEPDEVVLTLKPDGFFPAEVTRRPGRFQLSVDNRSGVEELMIHLKGSEGTLLREIRVPRDGSDWSELLDLSPGSYTLSEASHSNWVCVFIVRSTQEVVQMH